jgi:hypothetical protein
MLEISEYRRTRRPLDERWPGHWTERRYFTLPRAECRAERATMGFTHCETGRALAEKWHLSDDIIQVIAHHHAPELSKTAQPLVALVHLSDLLCRVRGLGYGYYERHKVDLVHNPAWAILQNQHRDLDGVDLARFTFELDDAVEEVFELVATIFGAAAAKKH